MLILLMGINYEIHHYDGLRWYDIQTKFHDSRFGHSSNINGYNVGITEMASVK